MIRNSMLQCLLAAVVVAWVGFGNTACSPSGGNGGNDNGVANDNGANENENDNTANANVNANDNTNVNDNGPANENDNTPPPPADACEAVNDRTFEPVTPGQGQSTAISFAVADGENTFQTFGDFLFGTFACDGFNITGETIPFGDEPVQTFTGSYNVQTGILTWNNIQYEESE